MWMYQTIENPIHVASATVNVPTCDQQYREGQYQECHRTQDDGKIVYPRFSVHLLPGLIIVLPRTIVFRCIYHREPISGPVEHRIAHLRHLTFEIRLRQEQAIPERMISNRSQILSQTDLRQGPASHVSFFDIHLELQNGQSPTRCDRP